MTHSFKIRSTIIFLLFIALYFIMIAHLYTIQIMQHKFYIKLAEHQYHVTITQTPTRGNILDRSGSNYLAINKDYVSAFILPSRIQHKNETFELLQKHFPEAYKRLQKNQQKHFMFIKRRLSSEEQQRITTTNNHDICLLSEPGRYYPLASAGQIVGLTNIDNKGLFGLELVYDHILAGKPTTFHLEKDARSGYYYFKKETTVHGDRGENIYLTIDADLQFLTQEAVKKTVEKFNAQQGAAIIMNPRTGEILSMVTYPYFDPNNTKTAALSLCKNSVITDAYELGSVIKVCAALAALEENVVTPDELIDCQNTLTTYIDGRKINTVKEHGIIPFTDVVAFSNNIGIAIVAKRLGTQLYDHYKKLGFGVKTGINFPGENPGFLNPPEKWSKQSIISLSYGYEVSATLLQLACAFCTMVTGYTTQPILVINDAQVNTPQLSQCLYSEENVDIIKNILERTTLYGTAKRAAIKGYRVMNKTGTANMLIDGKYDPDKNLYTSSGLIEKNDYERVVVTFIKQAERKNLYAATVAVPLFEEIVECMLIRDGIIS
jgi:cell division protein FtsI (penicillin-binding protein 3)